MGARYKICPWCGDHLDHGERCECMDRRPETVETERPHGESLHFQSIKKSPGRLTRASGAQPPGGLIAIPLLY